MLKIGSQEGEGTSTIVQARQIWGREAEEEGNNNNNQKLGLGSLVLDGF